MRLPCLSQGKTLSNDRLDLLLLKKIKQGRQVLSKPFWFESL